MTDSPLRHWIASFIVIIGTAGMFAGFVTAVLIVWGFRFGCLRSFAVTYLKVMFILVGWQVNSWIPIDQTLLKYRLLERGILGHQMFISNIVSDEKDEEIFVNFFFFFLGEKELHFLSPPGVVCLKPNPCPLLKLFFLFTCYKLFCQYLPNSYCVSVENVVDYAFIFFLLFVMP